MACTWVLTLETKAAQAVQGISWHASFVGEASAAGADDSKLDGFQRQLHTSRQKNKFSRARVNVRCVVDEALPFVRIKQRPCGLMDKALVFGTKDCRFESCQGHARFKKKHKAQPARGHTQHGALWHFGPSSHCLPLLAWSLSTAPWCTEPWRQLACTLSRALEAKAAQAVQRHQLGQQLRA